MGADYDRPKDNECGANHDRSKDGERGLGLGVVVLVFFVELRQLDNVHVEILLNRCAVGILCLGAGDGPSDDKSNLCLLRENVGDEREGDAENRLVVVAGGGWRVVGGW